LTEQEKLDFKIELEDFVYTLNKEEKETLENIKKRLNDDPS
jgi:hypothetical protein